MVSSAEYEFFIKTEIFPLEGQKVAKKGPYWTKLGPKGQNHDKKQRKAN